MTGRILVRTRDRRLVAKAIEDGFQSFLLDRPMPGVGRIEALELRGGTIHRNGSTVGEYVKIRGAADERRVRALKGKRDLVVVETSDWKVIPLENLIAALGGKTRLYAKARTLKEAELFLTTMERGVDGVLVEPKNIAELRAYAALAQPSPAPYKLVAARITRIEPVGLGERVCVDTASLFRPGEGLLIGSTSHGFFLVAAECYETEYVSARPFRVNAGAVHAYVLNGETTQYLSEIRAGGKLEAITAKGARRTVVVGRAKIETRPLLLVEAKHGGRKYSVLLQNAETIRLVAPTGRAKSVSALKVGDAILFHPEKGARHFGMRIEETIREQ